MSPPASAPGGFFVYWRYDPLGEAGRLSFLAGSVSEKLEAQKRRGLLDMHDKKGPQRDELIGNIGRQFECGDECTMIFAIPWRLG